MTKSVCEHDNHLRNDAEPPSYPEYPGDSSYVPYDPYAHSYVPYDSCARFPAAADLSARGRTQDPRLGATAHLSMCENSSYNSYEPYEKYQPIGDAPMASLGGASRFSPPRTSWRERPQRSVSPSHGSRMVAPVNSGPPKRFLGANLNASPMMPVVSPQEQRHQWHHHRPPTMTSPNEVRSAEYSPQQARPAMASPAGTNMGYQSYSPHCYANQYCGPLPSVQKPDAMYGECKRPWYHSKVQPHSPPNAYAKPMCDASPTQQHWGPYAHAKPARETPTQSDHPLLPPFNRSDLDFMRTTIAPDGAPTWGLLRRSVPETLFSVVWQSSPSCGGTAAVRW